MRHELHTDYELLRNMLLQAFKKNNFTLTMKLDWEKTGLHGNLFSWNRCTLPRVITRDPTAVTLEQLLQIPGKLEEITEDVSTQKYCAGNVSNMAMRTLERELYATNSSQDDTLDEMSSPGKEKEKEKSVMVMGFSRGTTRYCSINAHSREEQGRQDDLWSLFYMLVEMLIGNLPWKNMTDHGPTEREKIQREGELLEQCPKEFELYTLHLKQLSYAIAPGL
ncbi:hypothetical protein COOONC_10946 [Cooperia oncophora]